MFFNPRKRLGLNMPVEPPYGVIWNRLKVGKVIPFLGAGASFVGRPPDSKTPWTFGQSTFLPSGGELARFLAEEASFPSSDPQDRNDLGKVASYYADISGRAALRERLRELLNRNCDPGALHRFLASLSGPQVIVVTNYDTLVERAFRDAGKPYDLVVYPADRKDFANAILWWPHGKSDPVFTAANELDQQLDLSKTTVIFKMHGTIGPEDARWDNFVITEEDYVEFLSRMMANTAIPSLFFQHFRERSFLFLGYSLKDWNLRVVLKNLAKHLAARVRDPATDEVEVLPSWAIQREPSELERRLWEKRKVEIFDVALDDCVARLQQKRGN
jgi:hypothetical protein